MADFNGGAMVLMISIGHQTGLFDTLADGVARTSEQLAGDAGLDERYVREWLGAMATGSILEIDGSAGTYRLPAEHAAFLTKAAGPNNFAAMMQFIPLAALVEEDVVTCFREGGGVPYSSYPKFQKLMAESSGQVHDAALIDGVLPMVPGLVDRLNEGIDVADIGCGSGHAINLMAKAFPNSRFTGYDFSDEGVAVGTAEAKAMGNANASFVVR
ncbi:MAG: class I SAM-dependent methyltransferase, partial [Actinomycetota bacterium]